MPRNALSAATAALTEEAARARHAALSEEIAEADRLYHGEDAPAITDAAYDALRRELEGIEARFPELAGTGRASASVGAKPSGRFEKVRHAVPMLSLGNAFDDAEVEEETLWDYACGFLDEDTVIAGTTESDEEFGAGRHWLLDTARMRLTGRIAYPFPISGAPTPLGGGRWHTVSGTGDALHLWELRSGAGTADHG